MKCFAKVPGVRAFLFTATVFSAAQFAYANDKIMGGTEVTAADPINSSTVALLAGNALCTASIIDVDLAVTAAHCVAGTAAKDMKLAFGIKLARGSVTHVAQVIAATYNAKYGTVADTEADQGDIALVRFSGGLPAGYHPATILGNTSGLANGGTATLAGYGITQRQPDAGAGTLREVQVTIAEANHGKTEIVFDQREGRGACHGDSGGPAFINQGGKLLLLGVTNRGYQDDNDTCTAYGVYTKIAAYKSWIKTATKSLRRK